MDVAEKMGRAPWFQLGALPIFVSKLFGGVSGQPGNHCCYAPGTDVNSRPGTHAVKMFVARSRWFCFVTSQVLDRLGKYPKAEGQLHAASLSHGQVTAQLPLLPQSHRRTRPACRVHPVSGIVASPYMHGHGQGSPCVVSSWDSCRRTSP